MCYCQRLLVNQVYTGYEWLKGNVGKRYISSEGRKNRSFSSRKRDSVKRNSASLKCISWFCLQLYNILLSRHSLHPDQCKELFGGQLYRQSTMLFHTVNLGRFA